MQRRLLSITSHTCLVHVVAANYVETCLLGFVKSTSSIGCVGRESNVPVDSNAGPRSQALVTGSWVRAWERGYCFGAEDGTSVESSTGEPSRPSCAAFFVPQEQQCTGDDTVCHPTLAELP